MSSAPLHDASSALLLEQHIQGNPQAANEIAARYLGRLIALADARIHPALKPRYEGADAAQSALRSFFLRATKGQFELARSGDLWRLLATLAIRKAIKQVNRADAAKRRAPMATGDDLPSIQDVADRQPLPEDVVAFNDAFEQFLPSLPAEIQQVVLLRLEDLSTVEIATRVKRSERTIRRWLEFAQGQLAALLAGDRLESTEIDSAR